MGVANHQVLGLAGLVLCKDGKTCTPAALATLLWGAAKSQYGRPALYQQLLGLIRATPLRFTPRHLSNVLWALATTECVAPPQLLVHHLLQHAVQLVTGFSSQGLSTVLWAAARLQCSAEGSVEVLLSEVKSRAQELRPADLSQVAWACATLGVRDPQLFRALQQHSLPHVGSMDACSLANLLWGLSLRNCYSSELFNAAAHRVAALAPSEQPRALIRAIGSFRAARHYDAKMLDAVATRCVAQQQQLTPQDVATLAFAYADLRHHAPQLFAALSPAASRALCSGRLGPRQVANLMWAFAVAQQPDGLLLELCAALRAQRDPRLLPFEACVQLMQAHMLLRDMYPEGVDVPGKLPQPLYQACRAAWLKASRASRPSQLAVAVNGVLIAMGIDTAPECATTDGLFRLDIGLTRNGRRVAIEVDGPRHFTANTPHRALGRTLARLRCLELRGVRVVSIPFFEWSQLGCHEQRVQYLTAALDGSVWRTALHGTTIGDPSCTTAC